MQSLGSLKAGDTFAFVVEATEEDGTTPITGIASQFKCQVRDKNDTLIDTLVITETSTAGTYLFKGTKAYPVGVMYLDIEHNNETIGSTETVSFVVEGDITR